MSLGKNKKRPGEPGLFTFLFYKITSSGAEYP